MIVQLLFGVRSFCIFNFIVPGISPERQFQNFLEKHELQGAKRQRTALNP